MRLTDFLIPEVLIPIGVLVLFFMMLFYFDVVIELVRIYVLGKKPVRIHQLTEHEFNNWRNETLNLRALVDIKDKRIRDLYIKLNLRENEIKNLEYQVKRLKSSKRKQLKSST